MKIQGNVVIQYLELNSTILTKRISSLDGSTLSFTQLRSDGLDDPSESYSLLCPQLNPFQAWP
jgi:hypothetical protein